MYACCSSLLFCPILRESRAVRITRAHVRFCCCDARGAGEQWLPLLPPTLGSSQPPLPRTFHPRLGCEMSVRVCVCVCVCACVRVCVCVCDTAARTKASVEDRCSEQEDDTTNKRNTHNKQMTDLTMRWKARCAFRSSSWCSRASRVRSSRNCCRRI